MNRVDVYQDRTGTLHRTLDRTLTMAKLKKYPAYCRQSIVFDYKPPTNTRGQRWTVVTSDGCPIPEPLQDEPYQGSTNLEPWLLAWGLSIAKALDWPGTWVLGHVAGGRYILTQCGPDNPRGAVHKTARG